MLVEFRRMKQECIAITTALICGSSVLAQVEIPSNPVVRGGKSATRKTGGGIDSGAVVKPEAPTARYITHIVLHDSRFWTSADGKPLEAKLIAFEDLIAETPMGAAAPVLPARPEHPTVVRGGKIRLLVNNKPVEVGLDRFSSQDRELVEGIRLALAKKAG